MQTKVQKWGNSLGVRIPRGLAEEVGLGAGTEVSLTAKDGELVGSHMSYHAVLLQHNGKDVIAVSSPVTDIQQVSVPDVRFHRDGVSEFVDHGL